VKQFGYDRRDAAKMPGPRTPVQLAAEFFHRNPRHRACRIHLLNRRSKKQLHAFFRQQIAVAVEVARIFRQIFIGTKLFGIHKDRCRYNIAGSPCCTD